MKKKLFSVTLKDCRVDYFTVGGHGGGGKDTSNSGARVTHIASGAVGRAVDTRSAQKNRRLAFERMAATKTFKAWVKITASRLITGKSIEDIVDDQMEEKNLKIEVKDEKNRWIKEE